MKTKTKCKIKECHRDHRAKGFCSMHYYRVYLCINDMRPDPIRTNEPRSCTVDGCSNRHYAKRYCHNHYELNRRNGIPSKKTKIYKYCDVDGCNEIAEVKNLCKFHYGRKLRGICLHRQKGIRGKLNPNWNGGVSEYKNHYKMKKVRLFILEMADNICHFCGKPANQIHHRDYSKNNHSIENLVACCQKCNSKHRLPDNTSYISIYGMYAVEIRKRLNISSNHVRYLHKNNMLRKLL